MTEDPTRHRHIRDGSDFPDVQSALMKPLRDPLEDATAELARDIGIVVATRRLYQEGNLRTNPYSEHVLGLVNDHQQAERFRNELSDYETSWSGVNYSSKGQTRRDRVFSILNRHPYVQRYRDIYAVPLVAMMDIANQSDVGIYTQEKAAVRSLDHLDSAFATLSHNEYWRKMMGKHAVLMAERFARQGKRMDLVMVGDGSGELGATMAKALLEKKYDFRLIHLDIGEGMLLEQKKEYLQAGIDPKSIVSIKGSVIKDIGKIRDYVPDYEGGFFVLHEVLDALRTHSIISDNYGISELHQMVNLPPGVRDKEAFDTTDSLVKGVGKYLPFYNPVGNTTRILPFSPQGATCLEKILAVGDSSAIYVGDYGAQFILGEKTINAYMELPVRVYGKGVENKQDYLQLFDMPVDMTADVLPSIVYLSQMYGGTVEELTTQENYLSIVDPSLPNRSSEEIQKILQRAQSRGYKSGDETQLIQDSLFTTQLCNPCVFAAQITKGI